MLPLSGIRVIDMTRVLAGPFCTMLLGDLGAEVIKIEKPGVGDDTRSWGPPFITKTDGIKESLKFKSITLDVKKPEGREILNKLVTKSDIFVENYLPGKLKSMSLGYEDLKAINPGLIYCSISGFGQTGPYSKRGGYDVIASAMFGLMNITGYEDSPPSKPGVALTDISTGLYCHGAIMAALIQKSKTRLGQKIDASLLNTQIAVLSHVAANYLTANVEPKRHGTAHGNIVPYQAFKTKDGKYLIIGAGNNKHFRILVKLLDFGEEMADNPKFSTNNARVQNREELIGLIQQKFSEKSLDEWIQIFSETDMPYGPINNMQGVFKDPQVIHNKIVQEIKDENYNVDIKIPGPAVNFSSFNNNQTFRHAPPTLGQHTESILKEFGYSNQEINNFKLNKTV